MKIWKARSCLAVLPREDGKFYVHCRRKGYEESTVYLMDPMSSSAVSRKGAAAHIQVGRVLMAPSNFQEMDLIEKNSPTVTTRAVGLVAQGQYASFDADTLNGVYNGCIYSRQMPCGGTSILDIGSGPNGDTLAYRQKYWHDTCIPLLEKSHIRSLDEIAYCRDDEHLLVAVRYDSRSGLMRTEYKTSFIHVPLQTPARRKFFTLDVPPNKHGGYRARSVAGRRILHVVEDGVVLLRPDGQYTYYKHDDNKWPEDTRLLTASEKYVICSGWKSVFVNGQEYDFEVHGGVIRGAAISYDELSCFFWNGLRLCQMDLEQE